MYAIAIYVNLHIQAYGGDYLCGTFTLDFHPKTLVCCFDFPSGTFHVGGSIPHIVVKQEVAKESNTMNVQVILEDPDLSK